MIFIAAALIFIAPVASAVDIPLLPGNCSEAYYFCHELAKCEEVNNTSFRCVCEAGTIGDGLKAEGKSGCKHTVFPCTNDANCHADGYCNKTDAALPVCNCKEGFTGDGKNNCDDIDECLASPCDQNANCQNNKPGFKCVCLPMFTGDGFKCSRTCSVKQDCFQPNGDCIENYCKCKAGYTGDAFTACDDIDECETGDFVCTEPAVCVNEPGSYTCGCPNGYKGNGVTCTKLPINCHEIYQEDPLAVSGRIFEIDPDSTGPLDAMKVKCEFKDNIGITIVIASRNTPRPIHSQETPVDYNGISPEQIKGLVDNSEFCYQSQWIQCTGGYNLYQDNMMEWTDSNGTTYRSWGGSGQDGNCACGVLGFCDKGKTCNCDGSSTEKVIDFGKIIDSSRLPISSVKFKAGSGSKTATYVISDVKCAPKPIDLLRDCDEIKKDGADDSGPQVIDIDGPDGPLEPTLVHCDMKKFDHVAITVVPHDKQTPIVPTESGTTPLNYVTPSDVITGIIKGSAFCYQEVSYTCRNSPININGEQIVSVSVGNDSRNIDYFPGGEGVAGNCGCGITGSCVDKNITCNCDMNDNVTRYDIGMQTNPQDLPVMSITTDSSSNDSYTEVKIGPLMCAKMQFGIEPNCEKYRATGRTEPYTYLIDPDGPADPTKPDALNVAPFAAECEFTEYPPQGVTIIHHDTENPFNLTEANFFFEIVYKRIISDDQLKQLRTRSTYCLQELSFNCENYHLHLQGGGGVFWKDIDGQRYDYLSGGAEGDEGCSCNSLQNCAEGKICNCDAMSSSLKTDSNELGNVTHLPVSSLDFTSVNGQLSAGANSSLGVLLGPLKCYETFPTCYDLWAYMRTRSLIGETPVESGKYTIDPDSSGGVPAFTVTCNFPFTSVPVDGSGGAPGIGQSQCFEVVYKDTMGNPITPAQISALVDKSKACQQYLGYACINAPKTKNVNFTTCDGKAQVGWALSGGYDSCACGLTGTCEGGPQNSCNCDVQDGTKKTDGGAIYNTTRLPICEVCLSLDNLDTLPTGQQTRGSGFSVGTLNCLGYDFDGKSNCNDRRLTRTDDAVYYLDTDNAYSGEKPFPVYCDMVPYPAMGIMEIRPKESEYQIPANQPFDISITYFVYSQELVNKLIDNSYYCTQEIYITCNSGSLDLTGANGWYARDGTPQNDWGGNIGKTVKCENNGANCNCNKAGSQIDGGILGDKSKLPISRVKLGSSTTARTLKVGAVKCYEIRADCYDIMKSGDTKTPYKNGTYVIDPDGPDGVDPFIVKCHFDKQGDNAVTEVLTEPQGPRFLDGKTVPFSYSIPYEYKGATEEQINVLARQAPFCHQGILYECTASPISGNVNYELNNGFISPSFGAGPETNVSSCPCDLLGTCDGFKCRCDAQGSMVANDNGTITEKNLLPITEVNAGGQTQAGARAAVAVSSVQCSERPVGFPKDCEEAHKRGYTTGEVMIYPSASLDPFFVYCDMKIKPGHGVAIINPNLEPETNVPFNGQPIDVPYKGLTNEQIKAIVDVSSNCYQPVKYNCRNTAFISANKFSWKSIDGSSNSYFGAGSSAARDCTCGSENLCGGQGGKAAMQKRNCNCGIGDNQDRIDAGIFTNTKDLPVRSLVFQPTGKSGSQGNITIGQLYCGQTKLKFDECTTGFHDCHEFAKCLNTDDGFECVCQQGYRGQGRWNVWSNGRECFDDDECAFLPCPHSAVCANFPGSFNCTCKAGYYQTGPQQCQDIDECAEKKDNCDPNARCTNTDGSFFCTCKRGYRGAGTMGTCEPVGICACFGDPHCISFDNHWLHFMGDCQYVMSKDGCDGSPQTYGVWTRNWDMERRDIQGITWVKDVTVVVNNTKILLGRNREIRVDGRTFIAYSDKGITVDDNGREVAVITTFGLEVYWDGGDEVEVILPKQYRSKTCGLCGNYNGEIEDDWIVGDHCAKDKGNVTDNENLFGNSWVVSEFLEVAAACQADCDAPPTNNTLCNEPLVNYYCDRVFNPEISPFKDCLAAMDESLVQNLRYSCVFDICHVTQDVELGMCSSAERVVNECQKNINIDVGLWRKPGFCEISCSVNMEYRICGPRGEPDKQRQTTCMNVRLGTNPPNLGFCAEGCFCVPGYVLEGQKCILPTECGCVLDGVYMAVGNTYVDPGCSKMQVCYENGNLTEQSLKCGALGECTLDEKTGIYGCHCKKGYLGDGFECSDDPCFNVTCGNNMQCVQGVCQCKMGYTGDCNNCDDIDECATKTDNCIHLGQKCSNYIGGYDCLCLDGYVRYGNYCSDINECEAGFDTCDEHGECINTHGSYICECCQGYTKNAIGTCVPDGTPVPATGSKCCSCAGPACSRPGKVCGDDGKTYNNERALRIAACKAGSDVDVSYTGECKPSCGGVNCEKPFEKCVVDNTMGVAQCECPKCGGGDVTVTEAPVCSSRFIMFPSECEFKRIMCEVNDATTIIQSDAGLCDKGPGSTPVGPWTEWGDCDVDCGKGTMNRTREELRARTSYEKLLTPISETAACYGNCTNGPCANYSCPGFGQICVPGADDTTASCICPDCSHREDEPVCGLIGYRQLNFKNTCELQKKACEVNRKPHLLSESTCGALPLNCSLYTKFQDFSEDGCTVGSPVAVGVCEGGCGVSPDKCCEAVQTEMVSYTLKCANSTTVDKQISSVLSCKCNDLAVA
ncbi:hypothetical protein SNE40_010470 [Patella caerulea]|uniref:Uncharacterized protein n=1 Tax=Patella caerulea TaxID=87958 RepID=A0AAN8JUC9_PATCE